MTKTKKRLYDKLLKLAKENPDGFTVYVEKGRIRKFTPTARKKYVISKTNNNTTAKIKQSFRNNEYTGYAGGWYDKKNDKYYIDKNVVVGKKEDAEKLARRYKQLAYFDFEQMSEVRIKKQKKKPLPNDYRNPIVKKNGRYFNTMTKRYVSESYAKRINAYFKKNPDGNLSRARGHVKYKSGKSIPEQNTELREMLLGGGNQVIMTYDRKGNKIAYSPVFNDTITDYTKLKKLDYSILGGQVSVELYRVTRDKMNIYHILTIIPDKKLTIPSDVDFFRYLFKPIYVGMIKEIRKLYKNFKFSKSTTLYGHVSCYFYNDFDAWEKGKTFGFVFPRDKSGYDFFKEDFYKIFDWWKQKLEIDAYHDIHVTKISFYLYDFYNNADETAKQIAKLRQGVNRIK